MVTKLACAQDYVPAWYDYGPFHVPVLGFGVHMAEGGGTVGYLDNKGVPPARGVSVHFVIQYNGSIVQMLPIDHACGGFNPADRSTDKGYYGPDILKAVLGDYWRDPNAVTIEIEIEGFAAQGPNADQVASVQILVAELRTLIPSMRGAFGHADQTDTKKCPGTTLAMRGLFASIGGHGLWGVNVQAAIVSIVPLLVTAPSGKRYDIDGKTVVNPKGPALTDAYSPYGCANGLRAYYGSDGSGNKLVYLVAPLTSKPIPAVDETAVFNSGVDAAVQAAGTAHK